jgi:hypothetical protein
MLNAFIFYPCINGKWDGRNHSGFYYININLLEFYREQWKPVLVQLPNPVFEKGISLTCSNIYFQQNKFFHVKNHVREHVHQPAQ